MLSRNVGNYQKAPRRANISYRAWRLKSRLRALHSPINRGSKQRCWRRTEQFVWHTPLCWRRTRVQQSESRSHNQSCCDRPSVRQPVLASRPSWGFWTNISVFADLSVTRSWSVRCNGRAGLRPVPALYTPADSCLDYLHYTRGGEVAESAQRCKCGAVYAGLSNADVQYKFRQRTSLKTECKFIAVLN